MPSVVTVKKDWVCIFRLLSINAVIEKMAKKGTSNPEVEDFSRNSEKIGKTIIERRIMSPIIPVSTVVTMN